MEDESLLSADEIKNGEDWLNEHGQPDVPFLMALAADGSPESLEKLRGIADDMDAEYDPSATAQEIVDSIRLAAETNGDVNPSMTS